MPVPRGAVAYSPEQAVYVATELGGWHWAVKAQIHAGGRGKAGGVKLCRTYDEVARRRRRCSAGVSSPIQTGPDGKVVHRLYVENAEPFVREFYLGLVLDRKIERIRVIASRGRHGDRGDRRGPARRHPSGRGRSGGRPAGVPGARARLRPRAQHQAGAARR